MKKTALLLIMCLFATTMANAQRREVRNAERNLSRGNLDVALQHIQNATQDESTKNDPNTWVIKTRIYMEIAASEDPRFSNLAEEPLNQAFAAITKAKDLDVDNKNLLNIQQTKLILSEFFFNAGAIAYNANRYGAASDYFFNSFKVSESFGSIDTATLYNAGLAAEVAGRADRAIEIYLMVQAMDYEQPYLYTSLTNLFIQKKDFEQAEKWVTEGRRRFPDNLDIIFAEANVYLSSGNIPEARRVLALAIERDPDNANLHYAFAVNYDQMSRDTLFSPDERRFAYEEAIKAYKTAIELQPEYFDATYNLGALYFNEGIRLFIEAENELRANLNFRQYEEKEKVVKEHWLMAQPYLERAFELLDDDDPNFEVVLRSLRELYMRTNQDEKTEKVNRIWNEKFGSEEEE